VAFAIGRSYGPAVARNRLRRRLRAIMQDIDRAHELPAGLLLIGAQPAAIELTFDELSTAMASMIGEMRT
jgi:ribonuclease P protein component